LSRKPVWRLAALIAIWATCTSCVSEDARKAAELNWNRAEPGQLWCEVFDEDDVAALVETGGESGLPWQQLYSGKGEWTCTIAATMRGRGLDDEETPPPLVSIYSRLLVNPTPIRDHFSAPPDFHGQGTWAAESTGEYLVRRTCHRRNAPVDADPDELQLQLEVDEPEAIEYADLRDATVAAWWQASRALGCSTRPSRPGEWTPSG